MGAPLQEKSVGTPTCEAEQPQDFRIQTFSVAKTSSARKPAEMSEYKLPLFCADYKLNYQPWKLLCQVLAYALQLNYIVGTFHAAVFRNQSYARMIVIGRRLAVFEVSGEDQLRLWRRPRSQRAVDFLDKDEQDIVAILLEAAIPVHALTDVKEDFKGAAAIIPPNRVGQHAEDVVTPNVHNIEQLEAFVKDAVDIALRRDCGSPLQCIERLPIDGLKDLMKSLPSKTGITASDSDLRLTAETLRKVRETGSSRGITLKTVSQQTGQSVPNGQPMAEALDQGNASDLEQACPTFSALDGNGQFNGYILITSHVLTNYPEPETNASLSRDNGKSDNNAVDALLGPDDPVSQIGSEQEGAIDFVELEVHLEKVCVGFLTANQISWLSGKMGQALRSDECGDGSRWNVSSDGEKGSAAAPRPISQPVISNVVSGSSDQRARMSDSSDERTQNHSLGFAQLSY